ncbi:site-specific integrase [Bacillus amyloliquefaciens]|nr:site-specific integrase [Bacillus amyloliquefaciens]
MLKDNYLDKEQVSVFMEAAKSSKYHHYMIALTLLRTGLRKGELIALYWSDIDFNNKTLRIAKSKNEFGITAPKTRKSVRTISIDDTLIKEMKKFKEWQEENKIKHGDNYNQSPFLLPTIREMTLDRLELIKS